MPYQVINWDKFYENGKSRTINHTSWCPIPNKQDGLSYRRMIREHFEYYGIFVAVVLAVSKQTTAKNRDGWLTDDGTSTGIPWTPEDVHDKTTMPIEPIRKALEYFCSDQIKWMRRIPDGEVKPGRIGE